MYVSLRVNFGVNKIPFLVFILLLVKSDLQTTDQRLLTLLRNISPPNIPDPFAFLDYHVNFLYRPFPVLQFRFSIVYHFDPLASWSFDPLLLFEDRHEHIDDHTREYRDMDHRRHVDNRPNHAWLLDLPRSSI